MLRRRGSVSEATMNTYTARFANSLAMLRGSWRRGLVVAVASLVVIGGASRAGALVPRGGEGRPAAVWPMLGAAPTHASLSGFRGPDTNALAWRFDTNAGIDGGAAVDTDGTVVFGSANGRFFAIDPTGNARWSVDNLSPAVGVPALARGGKVYVGTESGKLFARNVASGALLWSFHAGSPITTSAAVASDGTIYFGTRSKGVFAVGPQGAGVWTAPIGPIEGSSPAIAADGTIYVGTKEGSVVALAADGSTLWQCAIRAKNGPAVGSPTINGNRLYVGAADGYVRALDRGSGAILWAFRVGAAIAPGLSLAPDGTIYFGAADRRVYALRDAGGQGDLRWATVLGGKVSSTAAVDKVGAVFVGSDDRKVYALETADGAIRWSFATRGAVRSALAIGVGGRVLAGSEDRSLYAIGEFRSGADCWNDAFIDAQGLTPEEAIRRFQILLAACGGPDVNGCEAMVQGGVNADRFLAAQRLAAEQIDAAQYLAILRDRTRKLDALRADDGAHLCDLVANDEDSDYIPDSRDACPDTPPLTPTFDDGCTDPTLPEAPSTDLVRQGLAKLNLLLDAKCDLTVPPIPALTFTAISFSGVNFDQPTQKELWFAFDNNQAAECGVFYEMEVLYRRADGTIESFYLVFPSTRGVSKGVRTLAFTTKSTDAGSYGAFTRSKSFVLINNAGAVTRYRLRATTYAGVRSPWGPLICYSCQTEQ
jgi:outer membrane protein assembly factor BamB